MIGKLKTVVIDAPDIAGLSAFYQDFAGWTQQYIDDEWVTLTSDDGWRIAIQSAPDHVPPRWPSATEPQQAHLDLGVPDLEAGAEKAIALGASLARKTENWFTLIDPAGHPFDLCLDADEPATRIMSVMLDCPDPKALSAFYAELLGKALTYEDEGMAMIGDEGDRPVLFQQVEGYTAPAWPDPARPQQFHLDVTVPEIEEAERAVLAIGATRLPGEGENWRVYADPAGKPFCLLWDD